MKFGRHAKLLRKYRRFWAVACRDSLSGPGEVIIDEHTEELEAGHSLHFSSINVNGGVDLAPCCHGTDLLSVGIVGN